MMWGAMRNRLRAEGQPGSLRSQRPHRQTDPHAQAWCTSFCRGDFTFLPRLPPNPRAGSTLFPQPVSAQSACPAEGYSVSITFHRPGVTGRCPTDNSQADTPSSLTGSAQGPSQGRGGPSEGTGVLARAGGPAEGTADLGEGSSCQDITAPEGLRLALCELQCHLSSLSLAS